MAKRDRAEIELQGMPDGSVFVIANGKSLGVLFEHNGRSCVRLMADVVKTIGKKGVDP